MSFEIAIIVGMLGITFLFAYLSYKLDENYSGIKLFLMLLSFLFILVGLVFVRAIAQDNYSTGIFKITDIVYSAYIYIFIFIVFFFVISFILQLIENALIVKQRKKEGFM